MTVLVVDDSDINLAIVEVQCAELGIDCVLKESGETALEALASQKFSLVLTDIAMPVMDGIELCRALRANTDSSIAQLPIVAVTSNVTDADRHQFTEAGFNDVLEKPIEIEDLSRIFDRWISGKNVDTQQTGKSNQDAVIDLDKLPSLLGTDEPAKLREWLELFIRLFPENLAAIAEAINAKDGSQLKQAAHKAKGSARSAAASRLADRLAELEKSALDGDWNYINTLVCSAEADFGAVEDFVKNWER